MNAPHMPDAKAWLRQLAAVLPGKPSAARSAAMASMSDRLKADTRHIRLTPDLADAVARDLPELPSYAQVIAAIRVHAGDDPGPVGVWGSMSEGSDPWERFIARRLSEGGPRDHLLSLLRTYAEPEVTRRVMARHYPAELREMDEDQAMRVRDQAIVRARFAEMMRKMAPPAPPRGATVTTRPTVAPEPTPSGALSGEALARARAAAGIKL